MVICLRCCFTFPSIFVVVVVDDVSFPEHLSQFSPTEPTIKQYSVDERIEAHQLVVCVPRMFGVKSGATADDLFFT